MKPAARPWGQNGLTAFKGGDVVTGKINTPTMEKRSTSLRDHILIPTPSKPPLPLIPISSYKEKETAAP